MLGGDQASGSGLCFGIKGAPLKVRRERSMSIGRMLGVALAGASLAVLPLDTQSQRNNNTLATNQRSSKITSIDLTPVKPETVGFSPERLQRLHALIQDEI